MRLGRPDSRQLSATLDRSGGQAVVVACPPHPQAGGDRTDSRLQAVSDALPEGTDCLRFDYGPWDEGVAEQTDARTALRWARANYDGQVGLFGYSFGAAVSLAAVADGHPDSDSLGVRPDAVSVLSPAIGTVGDRVLAGVEAFDGPLQVVYGERDDTVDWEPVVGHARTQDRAVEPLPADHFFVGQRAAVATRVSQFFAESLDR